MSILDDINGGPVITNPGDPIFSFPDGHRGYDLAAPAGTSVRYIGTTTGTVVDPTAYGLSAGYGDLAHMVAVLDLSGILHIIGHTLGSVKIGQSVAPLSVVGSVSPIEPGSGAETVTHTHYEERVGGDYYQQVDVASGAPLGNIPFQPAPQPAPQVGDIPAQIPASGQVTDQPAVQFPAVSVDLFNTPSGPVKVDVSIWIKILLTIIALILITYGVVKLSGTDKIIAAV